MALRTANKFIKVTHQKIKTGAVSRPLAPCAGSHAGGLAFFQEVRMIEMTKLTAKYFSKLLFLIAKHGGYKTCKEVSK